MASAADRVEALARTHYRGQQALVRRMLALIVRAGKHLDAADLARTWPGIDDELLAALIAAQEEAAAAGAVYVAAAVGAVADPAGELDPSALSGVASDGRPLRSLLAYPVQRMLAGQTRGGDGASADDALGMLLRTLAMIVGTQIADAGRAGAGVAITADRAVIGYQRIVQLPACSRCIILSGNLYSWSAGFARHPRCDCIHKPVASIEEWQAGAGNSPRRMFERMSAAEQDRIFGKAAAQAIRDGADINQVVNARRGITTAGGRIYTTEGTTARGVAGRRLGDLVKQAGSKYRRSGIARIMPEAIYAAAAGDRDEAIRLLKRFGYLT